MKKPIVLSMGLLLVTGCVTKNYYYTIDEAGRPVPAPAAAAAEAVPPMPAHDMAPTPHAEAKPGHYPVYGGKAHPRPTEPVAPPTHGDPRVPPANWDPNSGFPAPDASAPPPPPARPAAHEPAIGSADDGKYVWNKDRQPRKDGEHHRPTPPGAAALNNGQLRDPLSFPHFCGPGARNRGAC